MENEKERLQMTWAGFFNLRLKEIGIFIVFITLLGFAISYFRQVSISTDHFNIQITDNLDDILIDNAPLLKRFERLLQQHADLAINPEKKRLYLELVKQTNALIRSQDSLTAMITQYKKSPSQSLLKSILDEAIKQTGASQSLLAKISNDFLDNQTDARRFKMQLDSIEQSYATDHNHFRVDSLKLKNQIDHFNQEIKENASNDSLVKVFKDSLTEVQNQLLNLQQINEQLVKRDSISSSRLSKVTPFIIPKGHIELVGCNISKTGAYKLENKRDKNRKTILNVKFTPRRNPDFYGKTDTMFTAKIEIHYPKSGMNNPNHLFPEPISIIPDKAFDKDFVLQEAVGAGDVYVTIVFEGKLLAEYHLTTTR